MAKIAFLGDSLTKGTDYGGVTATDTFAYLVGTHLGYLASNIINAGKSANTTVAMSLRFQSDIVAMGANVCAVMGMFNDIAQNISVADYSNALRSIAMQSEGANIKCVFLSPPIWRSDEDGHTRYREYVYAMERVAAEVGCPFIDSYRNYAFNYLCGTAEFLTWYAPNDLMHQSKAGHQELASIMIRACFNKYWEPLSLVNPPDVPASPLPVNRLVLAIADYLIGGQVSTALAAIQSERCKFS